MLAALPASLVAPSARFVVFIAADTTREPGPELVDLAAAILERGATYVCCWGPDCSRFHDCFGEADVYRHLDHDEDRVIMTTWHDDDPLEEAAWFALHSAFPDEGYAEGTGSVLLVTVGNREWHEQLGKYLDAGAQLPDDA